MMNRRNLFGVLFGGIASALGLGCGPRTPDKRRVEESVTEETVRRIQAANHLRDAKLMSDHDILTKWLKYSDEEATEMLAKLKIQKLEELKLQILAQNPCGLMVKLPGEA